MVPLRGCAVALLATLANTSHVSAQSGGVTKPDLLLQQTVEGMPKDDRQAISVLSASFKPGDRTVFHTHRFPVTVLVLEGAFTLELEGREPVVIRAGQAFVEPAHVKMTGYNRSATDPIKLVIFYVADPGTPFLDMAH